VYSGDAGVVGADPATCGHAMKLTILGSTGGTGRHLTSQALAAGHEVIAFTRHPETLAPQTGLKFVIGDVSDSNALARAIAGQDAVLCALGGRPWRRHENVCSTAMRSIIPAMETHRVRRIVAISTFGAGDTRAQVGWLARAFLFGLVLRSEVADKEAMEAMLAASTLQWTVVRIGMLNDESAKGHWRAEDDGSIRGMGRIARADVAAFMLGQLDAATWVHRFPVVMY
jgi:uncharacterized protein YbjT (DUF2867 family)